MSLGTTDVLPPLTDAQKADLGRLAAMPDDQIDYNNTPARSTTAKRLR